MARNDGATEPLEGEILPLIEATAYEGENLGGRPRLYESPADFDARVDEYYNYCQNNPLEPMTITGLALFMRFCSVQTLYNYEKYDGFLESVQRARTLISYGYEKKLHGPHSAGAKFALSCIDGGAFWKEKAQVTDTGLPVDPEDRLAHLR